MSRTVRYAELFRLSLAHPFYADGRCPAFAIRPDGATRKLLANQRSIVKTGRDHVRVLASLDAAGQPFVPFAPAAAFRFHLVLETAELEHFTDLAELAALTAPRFTSAGSTGGTLVLAAGGAPALPSGVFAEVEVRLADLDFPPLDPPEGTQASPARLTVAFQASRAHWAYYCLTDLDAQPELEIVDSAATEPLLFSSINRRDLAAEPDPADGVALQLADRYPALRRIRFVSDEPVDSRQLPGRRLGLRRGLDLLSEPLPTPAVSRRSRIDERDVRYQVVKFLTQPFP